MSAQTDPVPVGLRKKGGFPEFLKKLLFWWANCNQPIKKGANTYLFPVSAGKLAD